MLFIFYLTLDNLFKFSTKVIEYIVMGKILAYVSSKIYDDVISTLRSNGVPLSKVVEFISAISKIPHKPLPLNRFPPTVFLGFRRSVHYGFRVYPLPPLHADSLFHR